MNTPKRIAAAMVVGAVMLGSVGVAQAAEAAVVPGGTITLTPSSGTIASDPFLTGLAVNQACPAGYQVASSTSVVQGTINFNISNLRTSTAANVGNIYGDWGFGANPISIDRSGSPTNDYVSNLPLSAAGLADGNFELRVYCFASATITNSTAKASVIVVRPALATM